MSWSLIYRIQRALLGSILSKLFYQSRVDGSGNPIMLKPFFGKINQKLMEKGFTVPWIMTREQCWAYWDSVFSDKKGVQVYAKKPPGIIQFLHQFWSPQVQYSDSILELGSAAGANLYYLHGLGYKNLAGIEISQKAVDGMHKAFPDLAAKLPIAIGRLEETLMQFESDSVDVIFTMAVAQHIHPTSNFLFNEMVRVVRKHICTIELEAANCSYLFARNYQRIFERLGCKQVKSVLITKEAYPDVNRDYNGYVARLFSTGGFTS